MKSKKKNEVLRKYMSLLLISAMVLGLFPSYQITYAAGVASSIIWSEPILEYIDDDGMSVIIANGSAEIDFEPYYDYYFNIQWTAPVNPQFHEGDFFEFTVPGIFAGQTVDILGADGMKWGDLVIESAADSDPAMTVASATITFNRNIEDKINVSGWISLLADGSSLKQGNDVDWNFNIGGENYTYKGEVKYGVDDNTENSMITDSIYKYGQYDPNGTEGGNIWYTILNMPQETIAGSVNVTDTFGGDYRIAPVHNYEHDNTDNDSQPEGECTYLTLEDAAAGYFTAEGYSHAYFQIMEIDWNEIRKDYNASLPSAQQEVPAGQINQDMKDMMRDMSEDGTLRYMQPFTGSLDSAKITEDGIEIVFNDGEVSGKCLQIAYWYELSNVKPLMRIKNTVTAAMNGQTGTETNTSSTYIRIGSRAVAAGVNGLITLFKQNRNGTKDFEGVQFILEKQNSSDTKSANTDSNGQLTFKLEKSDNGYEGTYILTEDPLTVPEGYTCGEPITLEVNAEGAIISVNGTSLNTAGSLGTTIEDTCWVSQNGLLLIVYNSTVTLDAADTADTIDTELPDHTDPTVTADAATVLTGTMNLIGKEPVNNMFSFIVKDNTGSIVSTGTNNTEGLITFGEIYYTSEGIYEYEVSEVSGNARGVTYDTNTYTVIADVTADADGILTAAMTYPAGEIVFTNIYTAPSTSVILTGTMNLAGGKKLSDNRFSFIVKDKSDHIVSTGTNRADGTILFGEIHYDTAGTYEYEVSEVSGSADGIIYDTAVYQVTVTVDNNGEILTAETDCPADGIVFNNIYTAPNAGIILTGAMNLAGGRELTNNMFGFIVKDKTGSIVSTGTNNKEGIIAFSEIRYDTAGTYEYEVSEISGNAGGITYDATTFHVTVTVDDNGGILTSSADYPVGGIIFNNTYKASNAGVILMGTVNLMSGRELTDNMFNFIVSDENGDTVSTGTNHTDGAISFGEIHYTSAGTYEYEVSEVSGSTNGITYDTTTYHVTVTIVDNGGILSAAVTYPAGGIVFTNTYKAPGIGVTLKGTANLIGSELKDNRFSFIVMDENDDIVSTGINHADGMITFSEIHYDAEGTHTYTVSRVSDHAGGIIYDAATYHVTVSVMDNEGVLSAAVTYPAEGIAFTGTYKELNVSAVLTGTKNLASGRKLADNMFGFIVKDKTGNIVSAGTNNTEGIITFGDIRYCTAGTYEYEISEIAGNADGVIYDTTVYRATVIVADTGGVLTAEVDYPDGEIVFNGMYNAPSAGVILTGENNLLGGRELTNNMFSYIVRDENGDIVSTGTNNAEGVITFGEVHYSSEGIHTYTVSEIAGNADGVTYDTTTHKITVTVLEEAGVLTAAVTYPGEGIVFNNSYKMSNANVVLTGMKNISGGELTDNMFSYIVMDENGDIVSTGTNHAEGIITFSEIQYDAEGTHTYTVSEVSDNTGGVTYQVTVTVADKAGVLEASVTYPADGIVFNSTYKTSITSVTLTGTKKLMDKKFADKEFADKELTGKEFIDKELTDNMFSFIVSDENGNIVSTGTNNAEGTIAFGEIHYSKEGIYTYTISEVSGNASGVIYDITTYHVTVTVIDNGGGLTAIPVCPDGEIVFTNICN